MLHPLACIPCDNHILFGDLTINGHFEIRKGIYVIGDNLFELFRTFYFGRVAYEVFCQHRIYDCQVLVVLGLGQKTADYGLVIL